MGSADPGCVSGEDTDDAVTQAGEMKIGRLSHPNGLLVV